MTVTPPAPISTTTASMCAGGATALWGLFGGQFEPVGFFVLITAFALFAAVARTLASFQAGPWPRMLGSVMTSLVATWITCLMAWNHLKDSPPLLAALAVASGLVGSEMAEQLARYVTKRWGLHHE